LFSPFAFAADSPSGSFSVGGIDATERDGTRRARGDVDVNDSTANDDNRLDLTLRY
jgi:hypothetical protein